MRVESANSPSRARRLVVQGDILVSTVRPNLRAFTILTNLPERVVASTGFAVLRSRPQQLLPEFLILMVRGANAVDQMVRMMGKGSYPSINQKDVESVQIPLPPLEVQREIMAEIEGYQKVVDGARAVVDNYRPHIVVDPEWPVVALGEVCTLVSGQHIDKADYNKNGVGLGYLTGPADFSDRYAVVSKWTLRPKVVAKEGDILIAVKGSGLGKSNILNVEKVVIGRQLMAIRVINAVPEYVYSYLVGRYDHIQSLGAGAAIPGITRDDVLRLAIPLPTLKVQQGIVDNLEAERSLVNGNRELIERFEKKIEAAVGRVWGTGVSEL